jgi:hypothetical protein
MLRIATVFFVGATLVLLGLGGVAGAYSQYSVNKDLTNCRLCHGDFDASTYTSLSDGGLWADGLHVTHRNTMLNGDCDTCHSAGPPFPVLIGSSDGGNGLDPISCSGCHGRAEDGTGSGSEGFGAGLRQHHWRVGIQSCGSTGCHVDDSDPSLYTPVEEDFLPPYYSDSDPNHPLIPADPCNLEADGYTEDYASTTLGLDNDGNDLYDEMDVIACPEPTELMLLSSGGGLLLLLGRRRATR